MPGEVVRVARERDGLQQSEQDVPDGGRAQAPRVPLQQRMHGSGHPSVGHIGILGVDQLGEEWYPVTLGGSPGT